MNRIIKKFVMFVLPFLFLFINVSYAITFTEDISASQGTFTIKGSTTNSSSINIGGYTLHEVGRIYKNYKEQGASNGFENIPEETVTSFNTMLEEIKEAGYTFVGSPTHTTCFVTNADVDVGVTSDPPNYIYFLLDSGDLAYGYNPNATQTITINCTSAGYSSNFGAGALDFIYNENLSYLTNISIKNLVSQGGFRWDGTYYYKVESDESDTPSLPSNSEIAQAVQSFYNSDYYKNNKDFKDFIVMYNYETKYFDFIGHNFGNKLGQQIIDADISIGYPPVSYNERWWRYTLPDEFLTTLFNKYYWLYSTNDFGENIKYEGKGSINDLLDLHFATSSIIVYSTTDYPVNTVFKNENDEMESSAEVMPGDHYTYDENLDPTTNEYDPLTNFIPTDPSENILGNVDFNEINKVFEENKDILNIKNASWLFTANNQLVNYFIGFLSFLIVLIIISRLLGG